MPKIKTFYYGEYNIYKQEIGELLGCVARPFGDEPITTLLIIGLPNGEIVERKIKDCEYVSNG